jgi:ATP-independent RNA helicase DbpA
MFSATYPETIGEISAEFQRNPKTIKVEATQESKPDIKQFFVKSNKDDKPYALISAVRYQNPEQAIVFCNTKLECQTIADFLVDHKISAKAIHGDLEQRDRDQVLVQFSNASCRILVATDVAARGIDVKEVDTVINYDTTRDIDVHTHRIGRTGRAGNKGVAINLVTDKDSYKVKDIEERFEIQADYLDLDPKYDAEFRLIPSMTTICFDAGRKDKLRPGDIVGALTAGVGLAKDEVGKINVFDRRAYVAIANKQAKYVVSELQTKKIKGRTIKVRIVR